MRTHAALLAWTVSLCLAATTASPGADDLPISRVFVASDIARLRDGVKLPRGGEFTIKVWAPARQRWTLAADGNTLTLTPKDEGKDKHPEWQVVGKASISGETPLKLTIAPADPQNKQPLALPAFLSLSTEAGFDASTALDSIRGNLDSVNPPADPRRTTVRTNQQGANFKAPATDQQWRDRARTVREQMLVTLGLWPAPPKTPLNAQVFGKVERDGYTIERVLLETLPGFTLGGNLYRPAGKTGKLPALLCPHGHWEDGRVNPEVQARCIHWAKLGCLVFMYDMVGYNDSKAFGHKFLNDRLNRWGISLTGLQTFNSIRAVDWLTSLPEVDVARVGCTGESGGGTQTFLLTALDQRIKISAPVVMVSDSFQGGCVCENAAGLRFGTDNVEFAALTAPRPLKLVGASGDWTAKTMSNAYPAIREVYALIGQPERVSADVYDFPHNYNQTTRNAVYAYMSRWLLGIEDANATKEGTQSTEKPETLWAYGSDHPAPADLKNPQQLEDHLIATLSKQVDNLAPKTTSEWWQTDSAMLRTSLRVRVGLKNPAPADLVSREVRRTSAEGTTVTHSVVGRSSAGEEIPVVRITPAHPTGRITVILSQHGKAGLVTAEGKPAPIVKALLDRGQSVVGFDAFLIGESADPLAFAERRPSVAHYETYNPSLAGDRAQDLATVLAWTRSQPDALEVNLIGQGMAGPLALLARPLLEGLARTAIDLRAFDYGQGEKEVPPGLDLPGVLQFGGLKAAAALSAPAPLWIYRTGTTFDKSWPTRSYELADASTQLKVDSDPPAPEALARWIDLGE